MLEGQIREKKEISPRRGRWQEKSGAGQSFCLVDFGRLPARSSGDRGSAVRGKGEREFLKERKVVFGEGGERDFPGA